MTSSVTLWCSICQFIWQILTKLLETRVRRRIKIRNLYFLWINYRYWFDQEVLSVAATICNLDIAESRLCKMFCECPVSISFSSQLILNQLKLVDNYEMLNPNKILLRILWNSTISWNRSGQTGFKRKSLRKMAFSVSLRDLSVVCVKIRNI